jgi:hypothetical protein
VHECWVALRDRLIETVERLIELACSRIQNSAEECHLQQRVEVQLRVCDLIHQESPHSGEAGGCVRLLYVGSDLLQHRHSLFGQAPRGGLTDSPGRECVDVPDLQIDLVDELACQYMLRVDLQRPPGPHKRVVVLPLMPIRDGDLHQNAGRSRIARERLLLASQPVVEPPKRFLERAILQERLGVIRINFERALQAALRRRPVPLTEKKHGAKGDLRVPRDAVHRQRA